LFELAVDDALNELARRSGAQFECLAQARRHTREELQARITAVDHLGLPPASSLCLMGSWGRHEVVDGSDADWLLIGDAQRGRPQTLRALREWIESADPAPGQERVFGTYTNREKLITQIGLDRDSNRNLTRRILLLLESLPLTNHAYHETTRDALLERYVDDFVRDHRVPLFLLNDIVRYWRTVCVDFAGKEMTRDGEGWGLRNAKLRMSRKLLFASGLLPVLLCARLPRAEMRSFLARQLSTPATDRVAFAFLAADAADIGARALGAYDRFIALLGQPDARAQLKALRHEQWETSPLFAEIRTLGRSLHEALVALLFETQLFGRTAREYGVF
jgi:hypothetical protein